MVTLVVLGVVLLPFLLVGGGMALFWKRRRRAVLRWSGLGYLATIAFLLLGVAPYLAAWAVVHAGTRPRDRELRGSPADSGLVYEDVVFEARDSLRLSGWFVPPTRRNAILVCTHGLFRNRVEMLPRAVAACRADYGALLYDSRTHGASDKGIVSLGYYERNDVLGAVQYIQRRYQDVAERPKIVLMGISMGAVATLEAAAESRVYSALVIDSPFASLRETVADHSWLFLKLPRFPFPSLFLFWFEHFTGVKPDRLNARDALARAQPVPLLILASEGDARIGVQVARELYAAASSPVKKLKVFGRDVPHGAAARLHPEEYAEALVGFLDATVGEPLPQPQVGEWISTPSAAADSPR